MPRHYRRKMRPRRVFGRSFKKVLNFAPASHGAIKVDFQLVQGVDSATMGQSAPTDDVVPTGCTVDWIEIQYGVVNLTALSNFIHVSIQNLVSNQASTIDPALVGGNNQRNQVHHQEVRSCAPNQNMTFNLKFRVPKQLRRVREGSKWFFTVKGSNSYTDVCQVIYKMKQ